MTSDPLAKPFIEPVVLAKWILEKEEIWQERKPFMEPLEFARFCTDRGIRIWDDTVIRLWQLGLLRADLVVSTRRTRKVGLVEIGKIGKAKYAYADARPTREFPAGLGAAASRLRSLSPSMKLFFHPFKFCVLSQYEELCQFAPALTPLTPVAAFQQLQRHFGDFQKRSGSERFLRAFLKANNIASLAIATEPCIYPRIFSHR